MKARGRLCGSLVQPLFQRHELVPVAHRLLFSAPDQCVDSCRRERSRIVAFGIHTNGDVGQLEIIIVFILAIHVHDLSKH